MDYSKIKKAITQKNYKLKGFIEDHIGLTEGGYYQAIKRNTMKIRDLEKISEALNLPMTYWFQQEEDERLFNEVAASYTHFELQQKLKEIMKQGISSDKDKVIKAQESLIHSQKDHIKRIEKALDESDKRGKEAC